MDRYKVTAQAWDKLAVAYQDKFMDLDLYNDTYDRFCRLVRKADPRIFEIGCGPGNITRYMQARRPDFVIEAIDVAPNMLRIAKENNPAVTFKVMDAREVGTLAGTYDGIMCGFCMPYLSKEDGLKLIKACAGLLNSGGILYLSTIEGDYQKSGYETSSNGLNTMFVYYHQEDYLQQGLADNHFEVVDLARKTYPKTHGTAETHLILIAKKK
ncbi:class I SAM-dependent methyltransferase [Pontibacter liquoris]|uniref:class I SAM-dependent methyltransferase n=1 Tax=Pontibacter liquoris TaxID=2905677 RepID=UPI001FA6F44B|nr:class I SAM-dependent methyltransferase [Pontibacter liquoris]